MKLHRVGANDAGSALRFLHGEIIPPHEIENYKSLHVNRQKHIDELKKERKTFSWFDIFKTLKLFAMYQ